MQYFGAKINPNLYVELVSVVDKMPEEFIDGIRMWSFIPARLLNEVNIQEVSYSNKTVNVAKIGKKLSTVASNNLALEILTKSH